MCRNREYQIDCSDNASSNEEPPYAEHPRLRSQYRPGITQGFIKIKNKFIYVFYYNKPDDFEYYIN